MEEALSFFRAFEVWIYLLLGLGGLIYIRKFIIAWQELRGATFGLERESAQVRLNQSASVLVLLLTMAVAEFVTASFIAPSIPEANPLFTPTLDLLATPTSTLEATQEGQGAAVPATFTPAASPTGEVASGDCIPDELNITSPRNGQEVSGVVEVMGTADIPNFGFYKIEMKRPDETLWLTIEAGNAAKQGEKLGNWDTRRLPPAEYQLGLVVSNNQAQASPPCIVQVRVVPTLDETPGP